MRIAVAVAALLLPFPSVAAQEVDYAAKRDTFQLFTGCLQMAAFVTVQQKHNDLPELTEPSVSTAVRSRLRAARIYRDEWNSPNLTVHVMIVGNAFHVSTAFRRWVAVIAVSTGDLTDAMAVSSDSLESLIERSRRSGDATTWKREHLGTHGGSAGYVRELVVQHLDEFIDEYLRLNEDDCP